MSSYKLLLFAFKISITLSLADILSGKTSNGCYVFPFSTIFGYTLSNFTILAEFRVSNFRRMAFSATCRAVELVYSQGWQHSNWQLHFTFKQTCIQVHLMQKQTHTHRHIHTYTNTQPWAPAKVCNTFLCACPCQPQQGQPHSTHHKHTHTAHTQHTSTHTLPQCPFVVWCVCFCALSFALGSAPFCLSSIAASC